MAYQALYRQWRPKSFSEMVGQTAAMETLKNQVVTGRIAHAYLFCGSRGTGKTSTAKILARAINCDHPEGGDPCGVCDNCRRAENEESLDIIEIDAASNNGVDEMRDLRETVKYPPQFGRYKVYIIDEVHMLSTSAFNALLKTLEEPPAHIVFILATTEPQKLPATILSRCQRFDFGRIRASDIASRLRQAADGAGAQATDGALMAIARAAEGGMRDALSILDMCVGTGNTVDEELVRRILGTNDSRFLMDFGEALARQDASGLFSLIDRAMREGRDPGVFAKDVSAHIRALLIAKCAPEDMEQLLERTEEDCTELRRQAESFTITRLMRILENYMRLETDMRYASTPRTALENTSLRCCLRTEEVDAQALSDRIQELESKLSELQKKISEGMIPAGSGSPAAPAKAGKTKASAPAADKAAPAAPPRPVSADAASVWKEAVAQIRKKEPGIYGLLMLGTFAGCEGDDYLWQANPGSEIAAKSLSMEVRSQKIAEILTEAAGKPCHFRASIPQAQPKTAETDAENSFVQALRDTFGTANVNVVD